MPKEVKCSIQKGVDLEFLADEVKAVTKEYLLWTGDAHTKIISAQNYFGLWTKMFRQCKALNKILKADSCRITETGVRLGKKYDITKECHEYLLYLLTRLLSPSVKPKTIVDTIYGRFITRQAYTEQERADLEKLSLRFEKIFPVKTLPLASKNLDAARELEAYLTWIRMHFYPLREILSEVWHGRLRKGDGLNDYFFKYEKNETIEAFRLLLFPEWFEIEEQKIILKEISKETFLFLLSGLLTREFTNKHYAWRFYVSTYFYLFQRIKTNDK